MPRVAARTGPGPTVIVALEQQFPDGARIIHDDLAYRILPYGVRAGLWVKLRLASIDRTVRWVEDRMPGMWSGFLYRKRYIDEKVSEAVEGPIEAVVNLGAGFDTRAFRLPALREVPVWEVDQPENIEAKASRRRRLLKKVTSRSPHWRMGWDRRRG